ATESGASTGWRYSRAGLIFSLELFLKAFEIGDVVLGRKSEAFYLFRSDFPYDLSGRAHNHRVVGNFLALRYKAVGADYAVLSDTRVIEHDGVYPDEAVVPYRAPVQHDFVPDCDALADSCRDSVVRVYDGPVLNV